MLVIRSDAIKFNTSSLVEGSFAFRLANKSLSSFTIAEIDSFSIDGSSLKV